MKKELLKLLDNAKKDFSREIPYSGKSSRCIDISDIDPKDLHSFMKEKEIPMDAYFSGIDNGYDGFSAPALCWEVEINLSDESRMKLLRDKFNRNITSYVVKRMRLMGYKDVKPVIIGKHLTRKSLYSLYTNDPNNLVEYFSSYFEEA